MSVGIGFDPLRAGRGPARRIVPCVDADGREAAPERLGTVVCDGRGWATVGDSSEAIAPQCSQKDFLSDERRPQFRHSMNAS